MGAFFLTNTRYRRTAALLSHFSLALALTLGLVVASFAATGNSDPQQQFLRQVENRFYMTQYDKEPLEKRLDRIEETVFGQSQSGMPVPERIAKLEAVVNLPKDTKTTGGPLQPLKPTPAQPVVQPQVRQAYQPAPNEEIPQHVLASMQPKVTTESDYPAVSEMEQKVFGKTYPKEELSDRLDRLDLAVFKTKNRGALADRTDGLRLAVLGDTALQQRAQTAYSAQQGGMAPINNTINQPPVFNAPPAGYNPYSPATPNPVAYQQAYQPPVYGGDPNAAPYQVASASPPVYPPYAAAPGSLSPDFYSALLEVENSVLKQSYAQDPVNIRLDRLETKVFNTTSPELGEEDRLQRVIAVAAADGHNADSGKKSTFKSVLPIILMVLPLLLL